MALKNTWRDRVDGIDDVLASDPNEIAHAVIDLEEAVDGLEKDVQKNKLRIESVSSEQKEIIDSVSNALKGSATGEVVRLDDVSPVKHEMTVKVIGVEDVSAVKVYRYGKNIVDVSQMVSSYGGGSSVYADFTVDEGGICTLVKRGKYGHRTETMPLFIKAGTTITSSAEILECTAQQIPIIRFLFADGTTGGQYIVLSNGTPMTNTLSKDCIGIYIYVAQGEADGTRVVFQKFQLEVGTTATEYEPYVEPVEYAVNADGSVDGVKSIYPTTTLMTDTEGAIISAEYNRDLNKAFAELVNAIIALGGNV